VTARFGRNAIRSYVGRRRRHRPTREEWIISCCGLALAITLFALTGLVRWVLVVAVVWLFLPAAIAKFHGYRTAHREPMPSGPLEDDGQHSIADAVRQMREDERADDALTLDDVISPQVAGTLTRGLSNRRYARWRRRYIDRTGHRPPG
jgi:hypothetical protein